MSNSTSTGYSITPPEEWDPVAASMVAGVVGPIAVGFYLLFGIWIGISYFRFIYFIQPKLLWAKNTEFARVSQLVSDFQYMSALFAKYTVLAIINLICAVMVIIGTFQCLGGAVSSQGAALVFLGLIFATIFGVALFFPNHELVEADNDVASAIHYTKLHPPVERDSFYVVTPDVLEAWRDRPESWSFEVAPWGPTVIEQVDAVAILDDIELFPMPFMMPLVDQDQDAYNAEIARMEGIAAGRIDADVALTEGDLNKASLANMNAMQLQEAAYKQRLKADQLIAAQRAKLEAGGDDDDDDEEVGPEVEIPLEEQQIRRQYAAMVDPRKMMFMRMLPINGVCTVVGNYPVPTWQEVSYFEVYIAKANKYTNVVVGLVTRPYPHWKFPGHCPHSVGMHSRGELLLSTCDFPREARGQPFACHATGVPGDINLGPWQRKVQIMQDTHFSRVVAAGQAGTDEEVVQRRRFTDMAQRWDCVGVMYNRSTGRVRFAINGKQLQPACHIQDRLWYPAIGVDDSCEVYVNFGGQPFRCAEYDYLQHGFGRSLVNPAGEDEVVDDEFDPDDANFE